MDGTPIVMGHGITDLCIRAGFAIRPTEMLIAPLATSLPGLILGAVGATAAQFVAAFREGLSHCLEGLTPS